MLRGFILYRPFDLGAADAVVGYLRTRRGPVYQVRARGGLPVLPTRIVQAARFSGPIRARPIPMAQRLAAARQMGTRVVRRAVRPS